MVIPEMFTAMFVLLPLIILLLFIIVNKFLRRCLTNIKY
jgi:hypothetical protein